MKIALIYTPRCGSTSLFHYFRELKKEYRCINEPWFEWMIQNVHKAENKYEDLIKEETLFIKSAYRTLPVPIERIINDFDKVIFLLRKNTREQAESGALVELEEGYLNTSTRKYWTDLITEDELKRYKDRFIFLNGILTDASIKYKKPLFYYEDLYYNDFTPIFKELGLTHDEVMYKKYLDPNKKYRMDGTVETKKTKTLF